MYRHVFNENNIAVPRKIETFKFGINYNVFSSAEKVKSNSKFLANFLNSSGHSGGYDMYSAVDHTHEKLKLIL